MKKKEETIVLLLFCGGILAGLLFPRWTFVNLGTEEGILASDAFRQYTAVTINYRTVLEKVVITRLPLMLLLYFSCYCAAGFWILTGTSLAIGMSMGFLAATAVIRMKYWGILFCCCALLPQWFFYGWAGERMVQFMEKRRKRTLLCSGNPIPVYNRKVFIDFLMILMLTVVGILSETYVNVRILRYFFGIYTAQT